MYQGGGYADKYDARQRDAFGSPDHWCLNLQRICLHRAYNNLEQFRTYKHTHTRIYTQYTLYIYISAWINVAHKIDVDAHQRLLYWRSPSAIDEVVREVPTSTSLSDSPTRSEFLSCEFSVLNPNPTIFYIHMYNTSTKLHTSKLHGDMYVYIHFIQTRTHSSFIGHGYQHYYEKFEFARMRVLSLVPAKHVQSCLLYIQ